MARRVSISIWKAARCAATALLAGGGFAQADDQRGRPALPEPVLKLSRSLSLDRPPPPPAFTEAWLDVRVNGAAAGSAARIVRCDDGRVLVGREDLRRWRIVPSEGAQVPVKGAAYVALDAIEGIDYEVDERTQTLRIDGEPRVFTPTVIGSRNIAYAPPDRTAAGGFVNYDVQLQGEGDRRRFDALLEPGVFNRWGFGTATFLGRALDGGARLVRLETAWTRDEPSALRSLRVGDSIGRPGAWGRAVRFGGLQWGTSFATRPDFVPFSLPSVSGEARLPSTVDLYVDNALRLSRPVPYGPFTFPHVPAVTGEGEIRLVVRDVLGRESVVTQPYYVGAGLLRDGLHDYTYETGFVRRNFAIDSDDYGRFFVAGTHRAGFGDRLTAEARAELTAGQQTVGAGATLLWPRVGLINVAAAFSVRDGDAGGFASVGVERQARPLSFGAQTSVASAGFAQLGASQTQPTPRQVTIARANYATRNAGTFFVSYVNHDSRVEPRFAFVSAGYSMSLYRSYYLSVFALQPLRGDGDGSIGVTLTHAFGARTTASASWNRSEGDVHAGFQLQQSLPSGPGVGYRLLRSGGAHPRDEASLFAQNELASYRFEAARVEDATGYRIGASGGVAVLGTDLRLSRRLDDSFALVKVGGYPAVPVYVDNQLVAHTDASGIAVVPTLRPYQKNDVSIAAAALPLDAQVGTLRVAATPSRRSGTVVEFPVRQVRAALLRIVLDDGTPLPAGAVVRVAGRAEEFPVARRGESYVTGLADTTELSASWKGASCRLDVRWPADAGPLPVLGPFVCRGVAR